MMAEPAADPSCGAIEEGAACAAARPGSSPSARAHRGAVCRGAGLLRALPGGTGAIDELLRRGHHAEACAIYRWFRPCRGLGASSFLVRQITLAEVHAIGTNGRIRGPRMPLSGVHRARVEAIMMPAPAPPCPPHEERPWLRARMS